jgi:tetratricopeptide (TPR) repeat protein/predicted aspartyl protease
MPITMRGTKPVADGKINGQDVTFVVDSGSFYSMLSPATAAQFKLPLQPARFGLVINGMGGSMGTPQVTSANVTLGGVAFPKKLDFYVGGNEAGVGARGIIGQNILGLADVEYDLANGVIRLIKQEGKCRSLDHPYWAKSGDSYSTMDLSWPTPDDPHTLGVGYLNGARIDVMFDTGAWASILSLRAAERAGVKPDSAGVTPGGTATGAGRGYIKTWIAPFQSFKLGDEEIRNTHLRIGEIKLQIADMSIGADFFLSHRVYVANKEHKLFFTYNGGPVFNLMTLADAGMATNQKSETPPAAADTRPPINKEDNGADTAGENPTSQDLPAGGPLAADAAGAPAAQIPGGEPTTADEFFRRGAAYLSRHDYPHALADLQRACELNPQEPKYFLERASVYWNNKQPELSDADIDTTLKLDPGTLNALTWRAQRRLSKHDKPGVITDLDAADHAAPPQANVRLTLGRLYQRAGEIPQAIKQYDLWIDAHSEDIALAGAYTSRCWARALTGQELDKALSDCNKALRRRSDFSNALASRGLVYLRLNKFDRAISDYSAALKQEPGNAWALYGRGLAESQQKKTSDATADMNAATTLAPHIHEEFTKRGIAP